MEVYSYPAVAELCAQFDAVYINIPFHFKSPPPPPVPRIPRIPATLLGVRGEWGPALGATLRPAGAGVGQSRLGAPTLQAG